MEQGFIGSLECPSQVLGTGADPPSVTGEVEKSLLPQANLWPYWKLLGAELLKLVVGIKINQYLEKSMNLGFFLPLHKKLVQTQFIEQGLCWVR